MVVKRPGGVLPEKLGRDVRPASQNPYPIYDQKLRFFLPYLRPDQKFDTLFMTWLFSVRAFVAGFIWPAWQALNVVDEGKAQMGEGGRDEKVASS